MVLFLPRCTLSRAADSGMRPSSCCRRRTTSIFCVSLIKSLISNNLTTLICLLHSKIQVLRQTLPTRLLANSPTLYISATPPNWRSQSTLPQTSRRLPQHARLLTLLAPTWPRGCLIADFDATLEMQLKRRGMPPIGRGARTTNAEHHGRRQRRCVRMTVLATITNM